MDRQQLLQALQQHVGFGQVTTYGNCSQLAFGHTGGCLAVVSMLNAIAQMMVVSNGPIGSSAVTVISHPKPIRLTVIDAIAGRGSAVQR